eukprot:CAMPEP_0179098288 /NCGR_PEP_ID=MMETSP0796-20121207/45286_1 /TAXON_ID=73915 /ORGANISM="Pyrodinium bahamense, Strain pbaha01" /LENGTH=158 /DNA_ID=CAMNT_0020796061 /DNA_START=29 /DNA_END=503 /DNA_ORIENTATION=-
MFQDGLLWPTEAPRTRTTTLKLRGLVCYAAQGHAELPTPPLAYCAPTRTRDSQVGLPVVAMLAAVEAMVPVLQNIAVRIPNASLSAAAASSGHAKTWAEPEPQPAAVSSGRATTARPPPSWIKKSRGAALRAAGPAGVLARPARPGAVVAAAKAPAVL